MAGPLPGKLGRGKGKWNETVTSLNGRPLPLVRGGKEGKVKEGKGG